MKRFLFIFLVVLSWSVTITEAQEAGKGSVYGVIREKSTGSTLPGATVMVKGTSLGTITDAYGKYILTGIPGGEVTLVISYVGYNAQDITVEITPGEKKEINVTLAPISIGLKEVVVTSQLLGQAKAINEQVNSDALVNVVSESRIRELPDINAAEAIGRIPGVAVQRNAGEGQKVMLRGLGPKYTAITLNGSRIPSNSSTDKSVDLSMISPDLLAGIEVYKSPTSDMDGEAVGGTVNLIIKKAPQKRSAYLRADGGYNSLKKSLGNYKFAGSFSNRFLKDKRMGMILQGSYEQVDRSNYLLGTSFTTQDNELYFTNFRLSDIEETRKRYGGSFNLDYNVGSGNISAYAFYSKTKRGIFSQSERYSPRDNNDVRYFISQGDIDLDIFSGALRGDHKLGKLIIDWSISSSVTNNKAPLNKEMLFRDLNAYAQNPIDNNNFDQWVNDADKNYAESRLRQSAGTTNSVHETYWSGFFNFKLPFSLGEKTGGYLKGGMKYTSLDRNRDYNNNYEPRYYLGGDILSDAIARYPGDVFYTTNGLLATKTFFRDYKPADGTVFRGDYPFNLNFDRGSVSTWYNSQKDFYIHDQRKDVADYRAKETISAAYLMSKLKLGDKVNVIAGVRMEVSNNHYGGKYSTLSGPWGNIGSAVDTTSMQTYTDLLPNFHVRYKPLEWMVINAAAVKTIARPNFNYVSPVALIDINTNKIKAGNPSLQHMEAWNYDLNLSLYNGKFGLFTIGGFYKDLKNIFYTVQNYYLASDSIAEAMGFPGRKNFYLSSYGNSPHAKVYGLEIDLQTSLKFLRAPFNGVVINANFTRLFSESTKYWFTTHDTTYRDPVTGSIVTESTVIPEQRTINMPGQVPYIFNLSVGYDYKGFSGRISGVFQGTYLRIPGTQKIQDIDSWRFWRWDASLSQKISKYLKVYLNFTNFNNQREESFINMDTNSPYRIQEYGMIIFLGLQAKF